MRKFELTCQPRFSNDPEYAKFLNIIRKGRPTAAEIAHYLGEVRHITKVEAKQLVSDKIQALCSHRKDVSEYNEAALVNAFSALQRVDVPLLHNLNAQQAATPILKKWLENSNFWNIKQIAIGARVALTNNIDISNGATNGSTGVVQALEYFMPRVAQEDDDEAYDGADLRNTHWWGAEKGGEKVVFTDLSDVPKEGVLLAVHVRLDGEEGPNLLRITRSHFKRKYGTVACRDTFIKSTFPLTLAYSMTGHRSQGATIEGDVIIDVASAFSPGLLYVMLSRIKKRSQLRIVGRLTPDMFDPILINMHAFNE